MKINVTKSEFDTVLYGLIYYQSSLESEEDFVEKDEEKKIEKVINKLRKQYQEQILRKNKEDKQNE